MNEPTAVAVAYGLDKKDGEFHVLVYHLGGATFEAALTKLDDGVFDILANVSSTRLGGEAFNQRTMEYVLESYWSYQSNQSNQSNQSKTGTDIDTGSGLAASASRPSVAMGKLKRDIERAKRTLTSQQSARIDIERSKNAEDTTDTGNDISTVYSATLTRAMFEELNDDLFRETFKLVEQVLREAGVKKADVDNVSVMTLL
jgi:heat shock protein 5